MMESRNAGTALSNSIEARGNIEGYPFNVVTDIDELRKPLYRIPGFVTLEWLRKHFIISNRELRLVHDRFGRLFGDATGFAWPEDRPHETEFFAFFPEALRYPLFLPTLVFELEKVGKDKNLTRHRRLLDAYHRARAALGLSKPAHPARSGWDKAVEQVVELAEAGDHETAAAVAMFDWAPGSVDLKTDVMVGLARAVPEMAEFIRTYLAVKITAETIETIASASRAPILRDVFTDAPDGENALDGEVPDPAQAWAAELSKLEITLRRAVDSKPSTLVVEALGESLARLRSYLAIWETSRPEGVSVENLIRRAIAAVAVCADVVRDIRSSELFAEIAAAEASASIAPTLVTPESLIAAEAYADMAEAAVSKAREAAAEHGAARDELSPPEYFKVGLPLFERAESSAREGVEAVREALAALKEFDSTRGSALDPIEPAAVAANLSADTLAEQDAPAGRYGTSLPEIPPEPESAFVGTAESAAAAALRVNVDTDVEGDEGFDEAADGEVSVEARARTDEVNADPLAQDMTRRADALFVHGEFGLAYHFAKATANSADDPRGDQGETWSPAGYGVEEMRLVALATNLSGLSRLEPEGYRRALDVTAGVASTGGYDEGDERVESRRVALMASVIPAAMLQAVDSTSAFVVLDGVGTTGSCSPFFAVVEALYDNRRHGFPITAQNLRAAVEANAGRSYVEELRTALRARILALDGATFRFSLGLRVRAALIAPAGPVGVLSSLIDGPSAAEAAAEFAEAYGSRDLAHGLIVRTTETISVSQVVDGPARERLITLIMDIAAYGAEFASTSRQIDEIGRNGGRIDQVRRLRDALLSGIERFSADTTSDETPPLLAAAYKHARNVLAQVAEILTGSSPEPDRNSASFALHVPLLWLPGMTWARAWTPSPQDLPRLVAAISDLALPRIEGDAAEALAAAVDARRSEDAFVAARMLLAFAPRFGWDTVRVREAADRIDIAEATRKGQLKSRHAEVAGLVAKVRRMALGGFEAAAELERKLAKVQIGGEALDVTLDPLPESIDGTQIVDVNAAFRRLDEVARAARRLLDEARETFATRIDALEKEGKASDAEASELRNLMMSDDLATLFDWIQMFSSDHRRPVLAARVVNTTLARFREDVTAVGATPLDLPAVQQAVSGGATIGPFDFSTMPEERREEIVNALRDWGDLKRSLRTAGASLPQLGALVVRLLSRIAFDAQMVEVNAEKSGRGSVAIDVKMSVPSDPTSLILPDFGSSTNGGWRVVAVPNSVAISEMLAHATGIDPRGTLILFFGSLTLERRAQIKAECVKRRCKLLVVDETLLVSILAAPERRPLSMFEVAQAFTTATPYRDYGRSNVPIEMFKGRTRERAAIEAPRGSHIAYGGRRLGKTALLRHIARTAPDHAHFHFLDMLDSPSTDLWERASRDMAEIFPRPVRASAEFEAAIKTWLAADGRRRVLLMLDEADRFVREQATPEVDHRDVLALMKLMAETEHRFKFVLAGLHNVSRITRSENSPLAQISSAPVRIGPLLAGDVGDAEALVRGPLAALGYEFSNREDVWRILSFTNYYPVLIQVFCEGLLETVEERSRSGRAVKAIDSQMVDAAMANPKIRSDLYESFEKTIKLIEERYELLTYVIAERALMESVQGIDADGLTVSEVAERAVRYWSKAFPKGSDPSEVEYLLDEMEGFGILRRSASDRWSLRSRMLLELMVRDEDDLIARLLAFGDKTPEAQFDPKNARRVLMLSGKRPENRVSPLTNGQEGEILSPVAAAGGKAYVLFGAPASNVDIAHVPLELRSQQAGEGRVSVTVRGFLDRADLMAEIKKQRPGVRVVVVPSATAWRPDWVTETSRTANVVRGSVRPIFIGGSEHARAWAVANVAGAKPNPRVRIETLKPWARSYLATRLDAINALGTGAVDRVLQMTGGWNDLCHAAFAAASTGKQAMKAAEEAVTALGRDGASARFGLPEDLVPAFVAMAEWCSDGADIGDVVRDVTDVTNGAVDAGLAVRLGVLLGLLTLTPNPATGGDAVTMNALVRRLLTPGQAAA